jgi:hypothetical protein
MKKTVITLAVVAFVAAAAQAQTTSANLVGYTKVNAVGGQLSLVALNFEGSSSTVADLFGDQLPANSKVHLWNGSAYSTVIKNSRSGWGAGSIARGDAFWIESGASAGVTNEVIFAGEVLTASTNTTSIAGGIDLVGYSFPVETIFGSTDLADALPNNSKIHVWNGSGYQTAIKNSRSGWGAGANFVIGVNDGFWVETDSAIDWDEARPFDF